MARGSWRPARFGRGASLQFGGRQVLIELSVLIVSLKRTELRVLLRGKRGEEERKGRDRTKKGEHKREGRRR